MKRVATEPRKTAADLGGIGMQAEKHWREHRPRLTAALEKEGTLYDHLASAETAMLETSDRLWKSGVPMEEAHQAAMREHVLLPDAE